MPSPLLQALADNPSLLDEVRKFIFADFDFDIAKMDLTVTNEILGQMLRARTEGWAIVEKAFNKIEKFKSVPVSPEKINIAR